MKIHNCEQGTPEWKKLRLGLPTASCFDKIITPSKGALSASWKGYAAQLLAEKALGQLPDEPITFWMERGNEIEPQAADYYSMTYGKSDKIGFITNDAGTIGASPDRMVGTKKLLEIKCPAPKTFMEYWMVETDQNGNGLDDKYRIQLQGQMWIAEADEVDIFAYHPDLPPLLINVKRDNALIEKMAIAITDFVGKLQRMQAELSEKGFDFSRN